MHSCFSRANGFANSDNEDFLPFYEKPCNCNRFIRQFSSLCLPISISASLLASSPSWPQLHQSPSHCSRPAKSTSIVSPTVFTNPYPTVKKKHSQAIITVLETVLNYAHNIPSSITFFCFLALPRAFYKLIFWRSTFRRICFLLPLHHTFSPLRSHPRVLFFLPISKQF